MKQCYKCKEVKSEKEFFKCLSGKNKGYLNSYCKSCGVLYTRLYRNNLWKKNPWIRKWQNAENRCKYKKNGYFKKGINNILTVNDVKYLWFRDNAYLLKQPSIDRINPDGNYELNNCRFIELKNNKRRYGVKKGKRLKKNIGGLLSYEKC